MNRTFRMTFITLFALAVALTGSVLHAQDEPVDCPLGGAYNEEAGQCDMVITINVAYPNWIKDSEAALTAIGEQLAAVRTEFLSAIDLMFVPYSWAGSLDVTYEEFEHGAALRSVVFTVSTYTGGAHPNHYYLSTTVDTVADRALTLEEDIFQPGADVIAALQPLVVADLMEQQGESADADWIDTGTDELTDYVAWAIDAGNLVLFFPPYQVAVYAFGGFQVRIPVDELAGVTNPMLLP
jgi:hypothetical protein